MYNPERFIFRLYVYKATWIYTYWWGNPEHISWKVRPEISNLRHCFVVHFRGVI
jgi:hypothetical protein